MAEAVAPLLKDDELTLYPPPSTHEHPTLHTSQNTTSSPVASNDPNITLGATSVPPKLSQKQERMFLKIIASGCTISSQQMGDPDLTDEQNKSVLASLLDQKPGTFLMRFGSHLDAEDLRYFDGMLADNYEIDYRLKQLKKTLGSSRKSTKKRIQNRRYKCLEELVQNSSYFSEEEMRDRDPLLYEYYIGQYLTKEEKASQERNTTEMSLSTMILEKMSIDRRTELLRRQCEEELEQLEESDTSSSEEEEEIGDDNPEDEKQVQRGMTISLDPSVAAREKQMLRLEFLSAMQARFLEGKDKDFDYSKVDSNENYDCIAMRQRDAEDSYFDEEEPSLYGGESDTHSGGMGMECEDTVTGPSDSSIENMI